MSTFDLAGQRFVLPGDVEAIQVRVVQIKIGPKWFEMNGYADNIVVLQREVQHGESPAVPAGTSNVEGLEGSKP